MPNPRRSERNRVGHRAYPIMNIMPGGREQLEPPPPLPLGARSKRTRRIWDAFWASPLATVVSRDTDLPRLERWIRAVDELEKVQRTLRQARLVRGSTGQPVLNPLASYASDLERTIDKAEEAFGMTPKHRLGLGLDVANLARTAADLNAMIDGDDDDSDGDEAPEDIQGQWAPG